MAKTKDEVCRLAARELGLTPSAQQASGPVFGVLQSKFDGILAGLQAKEIVAWGEDETPDECADALAVYLAQQSARAVGAAEEIRRELAALGPKPYFDFIAVAGRKWSGAQTKVDRF